VANYLDLALDIGEINQNTGGIKATPYFEDYLHQIIEAVGGEGASDSPDSFDLANLHQTLLSIQPQIAGLVERVQQLEEAVNVSDRARLAKVETDVQSMQNEPRLQLSAKLAQVERMVQELQGEMSALSAAQAAIRQQLNNV